MNKYQQKWAMEEFQEGLFSLLLKLLLLFLLQHLLTFLTSGRMAPGEMGNGVLLEDMDIEENLKKDLMFLDHAFNQYLSDVISVNRSLPDRRDDWCKRPSRYVSIVKSET